MVKPESVIFPNFPSFFPAPLGLNAPQSGIFPVFSQPFPRGHPGMPPHHFPPDVPHRHGSHLREYPPPNPKIPIPKLWGKKPPNHQNSHILFPTRNPGIWFRAGLLLGGIFLPRQSQNSLISGILIPCGTRIPKFLPNPKIPPKSFSMDLWAFHGAPSFPDPFSMDLWGLCGDSTIPRPLFPGFPIPFPWIPIPFPAGRDPGFVIPGQAAPTPPELLERSPGIAQVPEFPKSR